ncbi:MAG: peptide/nickel transport system ATP-binding protein [Microbacteriaceae bacterium]|jgi:ABC-type glutathione transport system ATPase component|nr:peptide/nickel transport system ATP-binding protein [Microbacteriaceae bacterium]
MTEALLTAEDMVVRFHTGHGKSASTITALNKVSLEVARGEVLGLVGESGSGKSTMARVISGLQSYTEGSLRFAGQPLDLKRNKKDRRAIQMVFQDPYASLDPRMTVRQTISEVLRVHAIVPPGEVGKRCEELMDLVQLPTRILDSRPGGMSGGQRQRIAIARALAVNPELLVADEAVSALDVSVQAGVVNLLSDLRAELGLSILFIAHDLAVVRTLCDRVAVIYHGDIVEQRNCLDLFDDPHDDYTKRLLGAVPRLDGPRASSLGQGSLRGR